jgi:hypothetical protein
VQCRCRDAIATASQTVVPASLCRKIPFNPEEPQLTMNISRRRSLTTGEAFADG